MMLTLRPNNIKTETLQKAGNSLYSEIDYASKQILANNTTNYNFTTLVSEAGTGYSISDSGADAKLIASFKKFLMGKRGSISASYSGSSLYNDSGSAVGSLKVSSFTQGFLLKNNAYFALKLNGNCTTSESTIYNPSMPNNRNVTNSCGLIFFDVNGEEGPNKVGIDQYIVSLGKLGIK